MNRRALLELLGFLDQAGYDFVPSTPLTHRRALANGAAKRAGVLRQLFGWSSIVSVDAVPPGLIDTMAAAKVLRRQPDGVSSSVRVARCGGALFLHSAFPTDDVDAVFFGPDSYRFARLIGQEIGASGLIDTVIDIGTGSGVGALAAARVCPSARVIGTDVNPAALTLARVNAEYAGRSVEFIETGSLDSFGPMDLVVANPPYIIDADKRRYRDGGEALGTGVAVDMAEAALRRLSPGGRLILYTGSPIVHGHDPLRVVMERLCAAHGAELRYDEIDPDVFGEELERQVYAGVERIALIAAVAQRLR